MKQHKMTDLGPAKKFFDLEINRLPDGNITLSQQDYIDTILTRFRMEDANPAFRHCIIRLDAVSDAADLEANLELYKSI